MKYECIIFDCDGVLVDSESLSAKVFQDMAIELGLALDLETAVEQFAGRSMNENLKFLQDLLGKDLPSGFEQEFRKRTYEIFKKELQPIKGVESVLDKVQVPYCVASSGPVEKIRLNLTVTGLIERFEGSIFSSYDIGSWKPDPGIFLHASKEMGFGPADCIVIEDSAAGIKAAVSGGFKVFALASEKKAEVFKKLGAIVFYNMEELNSLINFG